MSGLPDDTLDQKLKTYIQPDILLIDEVGFDRIEQQAAQNASLFFKVIDARYGKSSTWMTTNIGFEAFGDYLGDPVVTTSIVDRIIHHAIIISINGPSYRIHESKKLNHSSNNEKSNNADPQYRSETGSNPRSCHTGPA
jgi:DNA replication protein DnaC